MLTSSNGSLMRFEICKDGVKYGVNATRRLPTDQWTHVAVTLGAGGAKIYLDGEQNAERTDITLRPKDVRPVMAYLGRSMFDADPFFKGIIGDVCLYNYVLSADGIRAVYNQKPIDSSVGFVQRAKGTSSNSDCYDLSGRRIVLENQETHGSAEKLLNSRLPKGIYVVGGRKVLKQ